MCLQTLAIHSCQSFCKRQACLSLQKSGSHEMFLKLLIIIFIFVEFCIKFCLISMRSVLIISPTAEIVQILFKLYNKNDGIARICKLELAELL